MVDTKCKMQETIPDLPLISPESFWSAFRKVTGDAASELNRVWSETPAYTRLMCVSVMSSLAEELGLPLHLSNYWTIDAIFCREKHGPPFHPRANYTKYLDVAIEHENVAERSHEEMNKLQIISAPLKALITYPGQPENDAKYLRQYELIIRAADTFQDAATLRRQIVIFGSKEKNFIHWRAYVYCAPAPGSRDIPGFRPVPA